MKPIENASIATGPASLPLPSSPTSSGDKPYLLFDHEAAECPNVGGKFSRQAVLKKLGIPVPGFFCLTTDLYRRVHAAIAVAIDAELAAIDYGNNASIQQAARNIEAIFLQTEIPADAETAIDDYFHKLFDAEQLVSVRASIVGFRAEESEDAENNPFAGMSSSFLYVPRSQVLEKLKRCWASGYSAEAILYRHVQGMQTNQFAVAVGVQKMVFGERSFVMFTCNPQDLSHNTVMIAGYGIGEGVVQESVPVDHYFINSQSGEIKKELATKSEMLSVDAAAGYGLARMQVAADRQEAPCLNEQQIRQLESIGREIESAFHMPQDIEGTFTEDGALHILQARPIALDFDRYRVWSSANVSESFPGCTTPLTFSFSQRFYYVINQDVMRRIGVPAAAIYDKRETMSKVLGYIDGRIYHSITNMTDIACLHPLFSGMRNEWERLGAELHSFYYAKKEGAARFSLRSAWNKVSRSAAVAKTLSLILLNLFTLDRRFRKFLSWWDGVMDERRGQNHAGAHPLALLGDYNRVWQQVANRWGLTLVNWQLMIALQSEVERRMKIWKLDQDGSLISDLLCGDTQLKGVEIVLSAVRLAELVRQDPVLTVHFEQQDAEQLWCAHQRGELPPAFSKAIALHLHRYGDRGLQELKLEQPNLRDTPWELLRMVQNYARKNFTAGTLTQTESGNRARGEQQLAEALKGKPFKRLYLRYLLKTLRKVLHYREEGRYARSELFGYSKNIFRAMGSYLTQRKILQKTDDVFYLHIDELFGYLDGSGVTRNLQALVDIRKAELSEFEGRRPQKEFTSGDIVNGNVPQERLTEADVDAAGGKHMQGIGSSAGKVRGYARIVDNPSLAADLGEDSILIARETDPGWLFLMLAAKGIVVERGSMLSHTAITGRKFGIPTVVAVHQATTRIQDGQYIEIDGGSGVVRILEMPEISASDPAGDPPVEMKMPALDPEKVTL
ncbi:phosphoenolpyruvate synthase [soil metagenome]